MKNSVGKKMAFIRSLFSTFAIVFLVAACTKTNTDKKPENASGLLAGTFVVYIIDINYRESKSRILVDTIYYYSSEEYINAFPGKQVPEDGFFILNEKEDSLEIEISNEAKIVTQTFFQNSDGGFELNKETTLNEFVRKFSKQSFRFNSIPFQIKVADGKAEQIKEIYIP